MTTSRLIVLLGAAGLSGCGLINDGGLASRDVQAQAPQSPGPTIDPPAYVAPNFASAVSSPEYTPPVAPQEHTPPLALPEYNPPITVGAAPALSANAPAHTDTGDPYAAWTAGLTTGQTNGAPTLAPPQPSEGTFNVYGTVMANAVSAGTGAASASLSQISFAQEGADFDPDVSRDGRTIVFASTQHSKTPDIYVKSVDSRVVTQLTSDPGDDVMPRISADGTRIAFASNRAGNWDLYVMPVGGGRAIQVTSTGADDLHPSWSPDGSRIVFCRLGEVSGRWELWITDVGNAGVAKFVGFGLFPEWCPVPGPSGGDRIAFQRSRNRGDRSFGIWTLEFKDGQAGNVTEVASNPTLACINPAWSPDGQWIAYATVPSPSEWANAMNSRPPSANLWMADLNGGARVCLTSGKSVNLMPTWGPSNRLFFVSDREGKDNIWAMDMTQVVALAQANLRASTANAAAPHAPETKPIVNVPTIGGEQH
jgi:TolB protein